MNTWQELALSSDQTHFLSSYGEESSSALMYNLFADLWLGTNLVAESVRMNWIANGFNAHARTDLSKSDDLVSKCNAFR